LTGGTINSGAFDGCTGLKEVTFKHLSVSGATVPAFLVYKNAFSNCPNLTTLHFQIYRQLFNWKGGISTVNTIHIKTPLSTSYSDTSAIREFCELLESKNVYCQFSNYTLIVESYADYSYLSGSSSAKKRFRFSTVKSSNN
jgi:hypothetical protein